MSKPRHKRRSDHGARSLPFKRPFLRAILFTILHYLSLMAALTLGFILVREKDQSVTIPFVIAMISVAITWIWGFVIRRSAKCPLCKGTPLLDSQASKHQLAVKFGPFSYGTTAILSLIFTHRFRCMFCGTLFDLLKKPQAKP